MGRMFGSGCGACCMVILLVGGMLMFSAGMAIGIVGSAMYPSEHKWAVNGEQAPSGCLVLDWYLMTAICGSKYRYICYYTAWQVNYLSNPDSTGTSSNVTTTISDNRRGSVYYAQSRGIQRDVGYLGDCWYDTTILSRARWTKPNDKPYLGLMVAGWIIFVLGIVMAVLGFIIIFNT